MQLQPQLQNHLTKYIYYEYDQSEIVESVVRQSLENVENLRKNFLAELEPSKPDSPQKKKQFLSLFTKALSLEPSARPKDVRFERLSRLESQLTPAVQHLIHETPFQHFLLLKGLDELEYVDKGMFKEKEDERLRQTAEKKSADFILEFTELINAIEDDFERLRDLSFFLVKEAAKAFFYLKISLQEQTNLQTVKEYLYAEMVSQTMQVCMLKNDLHQAKGGNWSGFDFDSIKKQIMIIDEKNARLENENNMLKINILDLNDYIVVRLDFDF